MRNEFCKNIAEMLSFLMFAVIFDAGKITGEFYTMLTIIFFCFILVSLLLFLFYYTKNQDNNYYQYKKPTLFVICGLPASGKTTMAKKLLSINNAILL